MSRDELRLVVFNTDIGWCGVMHRGKVLQQVRTGFPSMLDVALAFKEHSVGPDDPNTWEKKLISRITGSLSRNAAQSPTKKKNSFCFDDIQVDDEGLTQFQKKVVDAVRSLGFGETASYGELAERVGHPGAARAVGTVMRKNRFPIIVPCHRVLSSNGLGGFTSPRGVSTKREMLRNEGHEIA